MGPCKFSILELSIYFIYFFNVTQPCMDNKTLWNSVLVEIEMSVSKANFNTWFKDTFITKQDEGTAVLSVPNAFVKEWLYNKYHTTILRSLRNLSPSIHTLTYIITKNEPNARRDSTERQQQPSTELPLTDYYINKDDNLNPRYTFDSFVVGPFNELAFAAAQAVIKKPGIVYNPLFIYGSTGHGKTHLIQAIGNYLKTNSSGKKVYYATSEKFATDYITAVQTNKVAQFKDKYRRCDVLVMDDIQFFSNKEKTQEELFHLFNSLYDNNKQIVFSSDQHPNFIPNLEDRLKSRFAAGMIIDIPTPDHESKVAILQAKCRMSNFTLPSDVIDFLAATITGNVRELEGVLNSIIFQSQLKGKELSITEIKSFIKNNTKPKKTLSPKEVVKIIADFYNIEEESIYEKTRRKEIIKPRQITMYILREDFNISYPSIGQKLGDRDHTTVIHSCEKIKKDILVNPTLAQEVNQLRAMIM